MCLCVALSRCLAWNRELFGAPDRNRTDTFRLKGGDPEPLDDGSGDVPFEQA